MTETRTARAPSAPPLTTLPEAEGGARALIKALEEELPTARLLVDPDALDSCRRDQVAFVRAGHPVAAAHRVPVVPRGAGSSLSGGANAIDGCIVLSLEHMDRTLREQPMTRTGTRRCDRLPGARSEPER